MASAPNTKPKTAYDVRRYLTLVQVIATSGSDKEICALCEAWGVERVENKTYPPYRGRYYTNVWATLRKLAQHVVEYHSEGK